MTDLLEDQEDALGAIRSTLVDLLAWVKDSSTLLKQLSQLQAETRDKLNSAEPVATDYEEQGTSEQMVSLETALAAAQGEFLEPKKTKHVRVQTKTSGVYEYDYAPLSECIKAVRVALAKHGLSVRQPLAFNERRGVARLRTILAHKDGGKVISVATWNMAEDIKDFGGQATYRKRYSYCAMLCIDADLDADEAPRPREQGAQAEVKQRTPPKPAKAKAGPQNVARTPADVQAQLNSLPKEEPIEEEPEEEEPESAEQATGDDVSRMSIEDCNGEVRRIYRDVLKMKMKDVIAEITRVTKKQPKDVDEEDARALVRHFRTLEAKAS